MALNEAVQFVRRQYSVAMIAGAYFLLFDRDRKQIVEQSST